MTRPDLPDLRAALERELLTEDQIEDVISHVVGLTVEYPEDAARPVPVAGEWTCFHCWAAFRTVQGAALHFGRLPTDPPACQATAKEVASLRRRVSRAESRLPDPALLIPRVHKEHGGEVRFLAGASGWCLVRRPGRLPFVVPEAEWRSWAHYSPTANDHA